MDSSARTWATCLLLSSTGPVLIHVIGVLFSPHFLGVLAQQFVERILLNPFAVVVVTASSLAVIGTTDDLMWMATQRLEFFAAVWACPAFEIWGAH
jgi:hypothetical protein